MSTMTYNNNNNNNSNKNNVNNNNNNSNNRFDHTQTSIGTENTVTLMVDM